MFESKVTALLERMLKDEKWFVVSLIYKAFHHDQLFLLLCCSDTISDIQFELLKSAIKVGRQRDRQDLKRLLKYCFFDDDNYKELRVRLLVAIEKLDEKYRFGEEKRHPVILIVDEVSFTFHITKS